MQMPPIEAIHGLWYILGSESRKAAPSHAMALITHVTLISLGLTTARTQQQHHIPPLHNYTPLRTSAADPPLYDVTEAPFFARGDSLHDDYPPIQKALDAAAAYHGPGAGATVYFPPHLTFLVQQGLEIRANHSTLVIDGRLTLPTRAAGTWPVHSDPLGATGKNVALLRVAGTTGVRCLVSTSSSAFAHSRMPS